MNFKFCLSESLAESCKETKFSPTDFLPTRADPLSAGWDVRCAEPFGIDLVPFRYLKIPLGFRVYCPSGWFLKLVPRSSTFIKKHIMSLYGTIDESYEGPCFFCCNYVPDSEDIVVANTFKRIEFGERIAQLIPMKRHEVSCEQVSEQEFISLCSARAGSRKDGGFGSSG